LILKPGCSYSKADGYDALPRALEQAKHQLMLRASSIPIYFPSELHFLYLHLIPPGIFFSDFSFFPDPTA